MARRHWVGWTSALLMLGAAVLACAGLPASGTPATATPVPGTLVGPAPATGTPPAVAPPTASSSPTETPASRGPGSFDLADPSAGLSSLTSYHASLQMQFTGTQDGQPASWARRLSMAVAQQPAARLWTIDSSAPSDQAISALVGGVIAGVSYSRQQPGEPCAAAVLGPNVTGPPPVEPADWLPPALGAEAAGPAQTINGLAANHYTFDERALDLVGLAKVSGEVWVASGGGFVVKYLLTAEGNADYFGPGAQGKMSWDYELQDINQPFTVNPPPGCPPGLLDVPLPPNAAGVVKDPGHTTFTTTTTVRDVATFYTSTLPTAGWQAIGDPLVTNTQALLSFRRAEGQLTVLTIVSGTTQVSISLEPAGQAAPGPTPTPQATPAGATTDAGSLIGKALNLTLGTGQPPALPSAHLEASGADPAWNSGLGQAEVTTYTVQADMQGADLHLLYSTAKPNQPPSNLDGFIVGGKEYLLANGQAQPVPGRVKLPWSEWPLNAAFALAAAASGPTPQGEADAGGRTAEVFAVDTANANPAALAALKSFTNITASKGTVWIDKATGALLKAVLDYQATFTNPASKAVLGTGNGHVEITVSNVGSVTVALP